MKTVFANKVVDHAVDSVLGSYTFPLPDFNRPVMPTELPPPRSPATMVGYGPIMGYDDNQRALRNIKDGAQVLGWKNLMDPNASLFCDELVTSAIALEEIRVALSTTPLTRPMHPGSAKALAIAIEQICRNVGYNDSKSIVALEQFTGKQGRIAGTRVTMENLAETIKNLVAKIIKWVKNAIVMAYQAIVEAIKGSEQFINAAKKIKSQALALKAAHGHARREMQLTSGPFVPFFAGAGKHEAHQISMAYNDYNKTFNHNFSGGMLTRAADYMHGVAQMVLKEDGGAEYTNITAVEEADKTIQWLRSNVFKGFDLNDDLGTYPLPFGNMAFGVSFTKHGDKFVGMGFALKHSDEKPGDGLSLPVLVPDEVIGLAHGVEVAMNSGIYRDHNNIKNHLKVIHDDIANTCAQIAQRDSKNGPGAVASLHFLKLIAEALMNLTAATYKYSHMTNKMVLSYCAVSLGKYGKPDAAPQPEKTELTKDEPAPALS